MSKAWTQGSPPSQAPAAPKLTDFRDHIQVGCVAPRVQATLEPALRMAPRTTACSCCSAKLGPPPPTSRRPPARQEPGSSARPCQDHRAHTRSKALMLTTGGSPGGTAWWSCSWAWGQDLWGCRWRPARGGVDGGFGACDKGSGVVVSVGSGDAVMLRFAGVMAGALRR